MVSMSVTHSPTATLFSDLLSIRPDGSPKVLPSVHHLEDLLEMDAEAVLERFKQDQVADFQQVVAELKQPGNPLYSQFAELRRIAEQQGDNPFLNTALFHPEALEAMFLELHEHVMEHPVWRHPFFLRVFRGEFTQPQLTRFALNYFNQVKNTRQCVALALGRFSGVMDMPYGQLNERISELSQIVLAQLVADEYGVGTHSVEDYPTLGGLFGSHTHIVMYRQLFEGLGVPFEQQDVPMLHGVADNVLIQRLVAGDERFTTLEALSSVGLGMEWGVPEFFTLLLGGMVRFAWQNDVPLTREQLLVFVAHVQYDVLHAISVMLVTSFYAQDEQAIERIKGATNMLMSGRYGMMSELYRHVFDEACPGLHEIDLNPRYHIRDRRIEQALLKARSEVADGRVVDAEAYRQRVDMPFVFAQD
jgi:pyrroloquinoline quinone (PQQ) biosynthesis protein C